MGYVALTTHLRPSNYSVGHKRLEREPSNVQFKPSYRHETVTELIPDVDNASVLLAFSPGFLFVIQSDVALYCIKRDLWSIKASIGHDCSCFFKLLTRLN